MKDRGRETENPRNHSQADLPKIAVDGSQMMQVFVNLIINGIEAMPEKGKFIVSARQVKNTEGKGRLELSFRDTGHGIPAGEIDHIFDPFYTTKAVCNTGLGLSISPIASLINVTERRAGGENVASQKMLPKPGNLFEFHLHDIV